MIQLAPQMRILVAVEAVDFRKYAPSMDMRSLIGTGCETQALFGPHTALPHFGLRIT
jgi:hypothetical protein